MSRQRFLPAMLGALALATVHVEVASSAHVARMETSPVQVAAGGEVAVYGTHSWAPVPVSVRWNSVDGEVLGTFPTTSGGNARWGPGTVRIPDVPTGVYDLVGTQEAPANQRALRGVPARARIVVTGPGGALPPAAKETPPILGIGSLEEKGPKTSNLVLVATAVFVLTLALGLIPGWILRRRSMAS